MIPKVTRRRQRTEAEKRRFPTKSRPGVYNAGRKLLRNTVAWKRVRIRLCALSQLPHLLSVVGEQANHLPVERWNIIRFAARDQVLVADHFLVHPDGPGVF
jgi:hypothetical protein